MAIDETDVEEPPVHVPSPPVVPSPPKPGGDLETKVDKAIKAMSLIIKTMDEMVFDQRSIREKFVEFKSKQDRLEQENKNLRKSLEVHKVEF